MEDTVGTEKMKCISHATITGLIKEANAMGIKQKQVVSIIYNNQYILVYYE